MSTGALTVAALLDKLTARQAAADAEVADLRERVAKVTDALAAAEHERDRWADARETVMALVAEVHPDQATDAARSATPAYQQILAAFTDAAGPLRAKEICQALEAGTEPRHVEGTRSKLKKLTARGILTEPSPGLFALAPPQAQSAD
ncbi:hypothetical protein [Streptomyces sp. HC307]|uniref:hypothetical protein n=1 Tax=Streptomyces flavusporus TaxID=3385496 RepID=UPI003916DF69